MWGFPEDAGTLGARDSPQTPTGPPGRACARSDIERLALGFLMAGPTALPPHYSRQSWGTRGSPIGQDSAVEVLTLRGPKARKMNEQGSRAPKSWQDNCIEKKPSPPYPWPSSSAN